MTGVLADVAEAIGLVERTVAGVLNRAALADAVFSMSLRFRIAPDVAAELVGVTDAELRSASVRAHDRHRRDMQAQQRLVDDRKIGVERKRHDPIGEPPTPHHRWCKREHHWVHEDEMTRNSFRASGYGDWCRACFRVYWKENVKGKR